MRIFLGLVLASASIVACSSDPTGDAPDATAAEDASDDAGVRADAGRDGGVRTDSGINDLGFSDPDTIIQGTEVINDVSTYVRVMGTLTSTLPAAIFLHTGPDLSHEYLPETMRFLLPNRLLVFYDMRATGRTSFGSTTVTTSITADQHAVDLGDIIDWIHTRATGPTQVDLLGHGYGAGVAALFAARQPARVAHLVLTAPFPVTALQLANFNAEAESRYTSSERMLVNNIERQPDCRGDQSRCTLEVWSILGPHYLCDANESLFQTLTFEYGSPRARDFVDLDLRERTYDWRPLFASITAPTTIISGPCDPALPEVALAYTASISGAVHHVLGQSGHFPMVEQRDQYQRLVLEALRR